MAQRVLDTYVRLSNDAQFGRPFVTSEGNAISDPTSVLTGYRRETFTLHVHALDAAGTGSADLSSVSSARLTLKDPSDTDGDALVQVVADSVETGDSEDHYLVFTVDLNTVELNAYLSVQTGSRAIQRSRDLLAEVIELDGSAVEVAIFGQGTWTVRRDIDQGDEGSPIYANAPVHNPSAAAAPTATDDEDSGYGPGSIWIWGARIWICRDGSDDAAVWEELATQAATALTSTGALTAVNGLHRVLLSASVVATLPAANAYTLQHILLVPISSTAATVQRAGSDTIEAPGAAAATSFTVDLDIGPVLLTSDGASKWYRADFSGLSASVTVDPTQTATGLTATLQRMLDWITNRIKAITGKTNWYDAPDTTLAAAATHAANTSNPHSVTAAQAGALALTGGTMSGDINADGNQVTNLGAPSASADAATKGYVDSAVNGLDPKSAVRAASTAALTLATDVEDGDSLDGVTLATGDRILLKNQADPTENGIWIVAASGAPARAADLAAGVDAAGVYVAINEGNVNADVFYRCTDDSGSAVVGTDGLTWEVFANGVTDHGALGGLGDDDHTQYTRADGTRAFTGDQSFGNNNLTDIASIIRKTATEITVSSNVATVTQGLHTLQPESSTADDIETVSGLADGETCILAASDPGTDTFTFKHGADNLSCFGGADISLSHGAVILTRLDSTVFVSGGGAGGSDPVEAEISGAAATDLVLDFSAVPIQRGESVDIQCAFLSAGGGDSAVQMYFEADVTATGSYSQVGAFNNGTDSYARTNTPGVAYMTSGYDYRGTIRVAVDNDGHVNVTTLGDFGADASMQGYVTFMRRVATLSSISTIRFRSAVATQLDVGTHAIARRLGTAGVATVSSGDGGSVTLNSQSGTSYTLVIGDVGKYVRLSNASAITLTVPPNASVEFAIGDTVTLMQAGAGQVTVAEGSGVTVNTAETLKLRGQFSSAMLIKVATDEWDLVGDLEAS